MSTPQPAADRFLEHAGARLRWRLAGAGPALALLHGWALDLEYWDPVAALLAARFTVLRVDRRGFGLSTGIADIHRNVPDLLAVLDAAGIGSVALVGMSQGARLALHFAGLHPQRTRALVLDGAPAFDAESELPLAQYAQLLASEGQPGLQAAILRHPLMHLQTRDPMARDVLAASVAHYSGQDLLHPRPHAAAPAVERITVPALILNGALDSASRLAAGAALQGQLPVNRRVELPHAGHLAALDDPAGYAQAVAGFCEELP